MINKNDLYDIGYALVIIRNDIRSKLNMKILSEIISVLEANNNTEDNQIRKSISTIEGLDEHWYFAYHNNVYVNHQILRNTNIYTLLLKLLKDLNNLLVQKDFEKAYDLVDCFHSLPEIIADNHLTIPKSFWKTFVKSYQKKWDNKFLRAEQKKSKCYQCTRNQGTL